MAFRVLIIGGTGQVGAAVVRALAAEPSCAEVVMVNRKAISLTADRLTIWELSSLRRPTEQLIERLNCRGNAAGGWGQRPQSAEAGKGWVALRDSPRETLANLSITGHLRCFSDQPVAEIVQCGEPIFCFTRLREQIEPLSVGGTKSSAIEGAVR